MIEGEQYREIPLTQGKVAIVDADMFDELNAHKWHAKKYESADTYYAARNGKMGDGIRRKTTILMHREITEAPEGVLVDHRSMDGLFNVRLNLRLCTPLQNTFNQRPNKGSSSRFKGVSRRKGENRWRARINIGGKKNKHLGFYNSEEDAARVYDKAAIELHGDFARLNFPEAA